MPLQKTFMYIFDQTGRICHEAKVWLNLAVIGMSGESRSCGFRRRARTLWDTSRLDSRVKTELVQRFAWGVPVYRQRFSLVPCRPARERLYRLIRTAMAHAEQLREPLECDKTICSDARQANAVGARVAR